MRQRAEILRPARGGPFPIAPRHSPAASAARRRHCGCTRVWDRQSLLVVPRRRLRTPGDAHLAGRGHPHLYPRRRSQPGNGLGPARRDLAFHGSARAPRRRDLVPARRPGPGAARVPAHPAGRGRDALAGHAGDLRQSRRNARHLAHVRRPSAHSRSSRRRAPISTTYVSEPVRAGGHGLELPGSTRPTVTPHWPRRCAARAAVVICPSNPFVSVRPDT